MPVFSLALSSGFRGMYQNHEKIAAAAAAMKALLIHCVLMILHGCQYSNNESAFMDFISMRRSRTARLQMKMQYKHSMEN